MDKCVRKKYIIALVIVLSNKYNGCIEYKIG